MSRINAFFSDLNIDTRLLLAGMGGVAGPRLAAAVANFGAGGVLGGYKLFKEDLTFNLKETDRLTDPGKYIGVNFIQEIIDPDRVLDQINTVLDYPREKIFFVFWGGINDKAAKAIKNGGRKFIVQFGEFATAKRAHDQGADAIVFQNARAGGHHLCAEKDMDAVEENLLRLRASFPTMPIFVSGGVGSGADLRYWEMRGANGVMCGTLFIATKESDAHPLYKKKLIDSKACDTVVTKTFHIGWENRAHRVIRNETVESNGELPAKFIAQNRINGKPYPIPRYSVAIPLSGTTGDILNMALYSGTGCEKINSEQAVSDVLNQFRSSYQDALVNNGE